MKGKYVKNEWDNIINKSNNATYIVVVGGASGTDVQSILEEKNIFISEYFDNSSLFIGSYINGIKVSKPYKVENENTIYIISCRKNENRKTLTKQLLTLGIEEDSILYVPLLELNDFDINNIEKKEMLEKISDYYIAKMGKEPDFINPISYTEKINADKIYMDEPKYSMLVDKYLVKKYVSEILGKKYVVPLLGDWNCAEEIDYTLLPDKFVLKVNHMSGSNIIVKNKKELDIESTNKLLNKWLTKNHASECFELQYKRIQPKIICEEYLDGLAEEIYDYQFFCFHGEPKYIWCIRGSHRAGCRASFYDMEWNMLPFSFGYPQDDIPAPKPTKFGEMVTISKKLSKDFKHVRVDLYEMPDGRVLFGELTFQTWGGLRRFYPSKYDQILGELI